MEKIVITEERLKKAYKDADGQQKKLLENLFGKELVIEEKYCNITDKIKSFEDACNYLHIVPPLFSLSQSVDEIAYIKLKTICKALNEKWVPQFTKNEYRYFPWFRLYTKEEWNKLPDDRKESNVLFGSGSNDLTYCGFCYSSSSYTTSGTYANFGSRLCLRTSKLAEYCGKQFIELWFNYLM